MAGAWIVARTKPCCEFKAAHHVREQGGDYYLPVLFDKRRCQRVPLFVGYLFVLMVDGQWTIWRNTIGVAAVLMAGESPATIRHTYIRQLKKCENRNGVIVLPGSEPPKGPRFHSGDLLKITGGALFGKYGLYDGMDSHERVRVLLDLLGRQVPAVIAGELVELAPKEDRPAADG